MLLPKTFTQKSINILLLFTKFLLLVFTGIFLAFIILETTFRLILPASDAPDVKFDPILGNIFIPNQKGIYIKGGNSEIKAHYRINDSGWNSPYEYKEYKEPNTYRIAVIGDSFIEALQVEYNTSYPYLLEKNLNNLKFKNKKVEVYTFGHSGANLIHYSKILEFVKKKYKPDFFIVNLVANDFPESLYGLSRKDNWSLQLENGALYEKPPEEVSNLGIKRLLRNSALVRFLTINIDLVNTSPLLNILFYAETRHYNLNEADLFATKDNEILAKILNFAFQQYAATTQTNNTKLLIVIDANRNALYTNQNQELTDEYRFAKIAQDTAHRLNIPLINLYQPFAEEFQKQNLRFDWTFDSHWNQLGHKIISEEITEWFVLNTR